MIRQNQTWLGLIGFAALVTAVGCGGDARSVGVPVEGEVVYQGDPVAGADVAFSAKDGGISAFARTDDQGRFEMKSQSTRDGIPPGTYRVKVTQIGVQSDWTPEHDEGVRPEKSESLGIPAKYGGYSTSGLTAEVVEGETNEVQLKLD